MPNFIKQYVLSVDKINRVVGRFAMYLVVLMMGVLFYSTLSKSFFTPSLWTFEMAQFIMVAYYLLGGGYTLQSGAHVRMDLVYDRWSPKTKATIDSFTILFLIFYLVILLAGGISSTSYALEYGERGRTIWAPYIAPIKIIACIGILLMLAQAFAELFRDIAKLRGLDWTSQLVLDERARAATAKENAAKTKAEAGELAS